jgi:prevent-host-death family protein
MRTAKISELKAKLSAHIGYVKHGEEVLILDRNTPVARLVPAAPMDDDDERTRRLIAKGIMASPKKPRQPGEVWPEPVRTKKKITREIMEQVWREERDGR